MNVIHAAEDGSCCAHYDPAIVPVFECATCHRLVGWCMGCADEFPDDCDDCREEKRCRNQ